MFICSMQEHGDNNFGRDWNGPISEDDNIVDIPEVNNPMLQEEEELQSIISPTALSDNFGVDIIYIRV